MKIKRIIILLIAFLLLFSTVSCSDKDKQSGGTKKEGEESKIDGSILVPEESVIEVWGGVDEAILDGFYQTYPELEVEFTGDVAGVFDEDKSVDLPKLAAAMSTGDQPDLFCGMMTPSEAYYSGLYQPVHKYLEADPDFNIEDMEPYSFEMTTFNDIIYFIPMNFTIDLLCWNKKLFKEIGLDPEKPPATWDEYLEMCQLLITTNPSGKIKTIGQDPSFSWEGWHLGAFGQHYVDKTGLNFSWDTPEYLETFELIRSLPDMYGGNEKLGDAQLRFIFGQTGFTGWNGSALRSLSGMVGFEYGVTKFPKRTEDSPDYYPVAANSHYSIPLDADNPAGGWKLLTYIMTEGKIDSEIRNYQDNADDFMPTYIYHIPSREKLYDHLKDLMVEKDWERLMERDELESKRNCWKYSSPIQSEIRMYFNKQYKKMVDGEMAPKDFLEDMQKQSEIKINDFIKRKKEEGWTFEEGKAGIPPTRNN